MESNEIKKIAEILKKHKTKYSKKEIEDAVKAEGYSIKETRLILEEIYKPEKKVTEKPKEEKKVEKPDEFKEVDSLLNEMKASIPKVNKPVQPQKPKIERPKPIIIKEPSNNVSEKEEPVNVQNKEDLDFQNMPRRLRRFYREQDETPVEGTEKHYKHRLRELKEDKPEESNNVVDIIYKQVKEKTDIDASREKIKEVTNNEISRFKERHNREPSKRDELNKVVDNIFTQLTTPNLQEQEEEKYAKTEGKPEKKEDIKNVEPAKKSNTFDLDLNLPDFGSNNKINSNDLNDLDLNLNLDLNLEPAKKKENKKTKQK